MTAEACGDFGLRSGLESQAFGHAFRQIGMREEPYPMAGWGFALVGALFAGDVAGVWVSLARVSRSVMTWGVVSVMVAWKVACRMGAFHTIWMSKTA